MQYTHQPPVYENRQRVYRITLLKTQLDQALQTVSLRITILSLRRRFGSLAALLYAERHNTVHNVVVVLLERLDCLLPADASLRHDELNVLGLETRVVDFLAIVLFLLSDLLRSIALDGFALVSISSVIVAGVVIGGLRSELLGRGCLGLRVQVLNLSFAEDTV